MRFDTIPSILLHRLSVYVDSITARQGYFGPKINVHT